MNIAAHKEYTDRLEEINKKNIGSIQWIGLKYKETIDELGNVINTISNSFFNIQEDGTEKNEETIKNMTSIENSDITARKKATEIAKKSVISIQNDITQDKNIIPSVKLLLLKAIAQILKKITIIELATPLEATKYSYILDTKTNTVSQDNNKKNKLGHLKKWYKWDIQQIERIQNTIYGPKISSVPEEKDLIMQNLSELATKNKDKITEEEQLKFSEFITKFPISTSIKDVSKIKKIPMKGSISLTNAKNIANYAINSFYNIPKWNAISQIGRNNLSVNTDKQEINLPANKPSFPEWSLATIIEHEIWWHVVRGAQGKQRLWFAWANYENIEEWITKLNEYLMHYDTLEDIPLEPWIAHISVFIGENYNFQDTLQLLKIYFKLKWKSDIDAQKLALTRTKRIKSYYARDQPWSNRKDVIYYRGAKKLIEYLKTLSPEERAEFYNDAYFATLSFEDITLVPEFKNQLEIPKETTDIPFPLRKLILRKQTYENPNTWTSLGAFSTKEKIQKNLIGEDFRFLKLDPLTREKKKQVINIMQYKEESKEYNNLKKDLEQINIMLRTWVITNPEDLFTSKITKKLFNKRRNMERKEITNDKELSLENKTRGIFSYNDLLQKIGNEIEWILTRKL